MNKVYSRIESIVGSVITVKADNVAYGELAEIETRFGKSLAEVNKIEGDVVSLQVFAGGRGISTGDHIKFLGHQMKVSFSDDLLGRIFNGSAEPRDNGPALTDSLVTIGGPSVNPSKRIMAKRTHWLYLRNCLFSQFLVNLTTSCLPALPCRLKLT